MFQCFVPHDISVTDMLVAVLNTCTKEELDEPDEDAATAESPEISIEERDARRKAIKGKIRAVGRMARVFALLRYDIRFS